MIFSVYFQSEDSKLSPILHNSLLLPFAAPSPSGSPTAGGVLLVLPQLSFLTEWCTLACTHTQSTLALFSSGEFFSWHISMSQSKCEGQRFSGSQAGRSKLHPSFKPYTESSESSFFWAQGPQALAPTRKLSLLQHLLGPINPVGHSGFLLSAMSLGSSSSLTPKDLPN